MRDIIVVSIAAAGCLAALRRPWIGIIVWNWISIMNPHRYCFGFAHDAPLAMAAALCTFIGMLASRDERASPFKGPAVTVLLLFMIWMTLSWLFGLDLSGDYPEWSKVMKIDVMVLVGLMVLHDKRHIMALAWVVIGSLMLLGMKGGLFTFLNGGGERVWGPPGSFIEDNNEFGLAIIMTIPMIRFLQQQLVPGWKRNTLTFAMLLCAASALGSQSRGALLGISAMVLLYWWRGRNRIWNGIAIAIVATLLVSFMPSTWVNRMNTIEDYQDDGSAMGRLAAWSAAWNQSFHYPFGVGYNGARQELFDLYSYNPGAGARAAHSIYFQVLGNHGFVGLGLFVTIWLITFWQAGWLRSEGAKFPEARWCSDLGGMVQASLLGYFVGGAFLSLAYFDLPYNLMMLVTLCCVWVRTKAWQREPVYVAGKTWVPGLAQVKR